MNFLTAVNLLKNELQNATIQNLASAPTTPAKGQIYFNTGDNVLYVNAGTSGSPSWVACSFALSADCVKDSHIDWGTGAGQVSAADMPIADSGTIITATDVEGALQEIKTAVDLNTAKVTNATHSGDVSGSTTLTIGANKVTFAMHATQAADTVVGNATSGTAVPSAIAVAEQTILGRKTGGRFGALIPADARSAIELNNVTNNAQVKKAASSTDGFIPVWSGGSGDALAVGYEVETTLAGSATKIPRADAVKTYIDNLLGTNDAMVFKGTVGSGGTHEIAAFNALATYQAGWSYKVITAGTIKGKVCEVGDMVVATVDRAGSGNVDADWIVLQTNVDGVVTGPASAVSDNFASFNGTGGKTLKDSGYSAASFCRRYSAAIGNGVLTTVPVTHNLNQAFVSVVLRRTGSPYDYVYADYVYVDANTVNLIFAVAPTTGEFTVLVIG